MREKDAPRGGLRARVVTAVLWLGAAFLGAHSRAQQPNLPPVNPTSAYAVPPPQPSDGQAPATVGAARIPLPLPLPGMGARPTPGSPGLPRGRRPIPGSLLDPGASGPGIGSVSREQFLGGALDPETGWPFVFLDHFQPKHDRVESFWIVQTRDCPQDRMGTDPWACLRVLHFGPRGELHERHPSELFAQTVGRPVLIQVQGSLTTPDIALGGLLWTHSWLQYHRALTQDAVIVAFDWPSQRVYKFGPRDINEKGRRAYLAAYHLARFVQGFPPESRICLLGQSYGGRVVPSALHLLGGGCLNSQDHDAPVRLPGLRPDLHLRGVILAGASDHDWLDPGERLDHALPACEAFLNLYNRKDEALRGYPFLVRSGHKRALGKLGLTNKDLDRLGPLAARYAEFDTHDQLRSEHTLLDAVANPTIARHIAPYVWAPDPGPQPEWPERAPRGRGLGPARGGSDGSRGGLFRSAN